MSATQARGIVASSFVAGLLLAAAVVAPQAWEPVPEPVAIPQRHEEIIADPVATETAIAIAVRAAEQPPTSVDPPRPPVRLAALPEASVTVVLPPAEEPSPPVAVVRELNSRSQPPEANVAPDGSLGSPPIPGETWNDPDAVNWSKVPAADIAPPAPPRDDRPLARLKARRLERQSERARHKLARRDEPPSAPPSTPDRTVPGAAQWPTPQALIEAFEEAAEAEAREANGPAARRAAWLREAVGLLEDVLATAGPRDPGAAAALLALGDGIRTGLAASDEDPDATRSAETRRIALAIARRVALWRAASALHQDGGAANATPQERATAEYATMALLDAIERFESTGSAEDAAFITSAAKQLESLPLPTAHALSREVAEHYRTANVRLSVHREFLDRLMPAPESDHGPVDELILGRRVRGTRTVKRSTSVEFKPDATSVNLELHVKGDINSHTVVESGPVSVKSRSLSSFSVRQPIRVTAEGLKIGKPQAQAAAKGRNDNLETSFDSVPIMRSVVRNIAESQHQDAMPEATREMLNRIVSRSRQEMEEQSGPRLAEVQQSVRKSLWEPLARMGLEPTPLSLETSQSSATVRLRLAGGGQLSGHTPRPRPPATAVASMQVHESSLNNAADQLGIAGRLMRLEDLVALVRHRLGLEGPAGEDLPEDVRVKFAASEPIRITAENGLVRIRIAIDLLESGRRNWEGIVASVAYRPTVSGLQVFLERDGVVQLSGEGQRGRFEIALRAVFSKVFPKERPVPLVPQRIVENPRMKGLEVVQAAVTDGWLAMSIGPSAARPTASASGVRARRF